MSINNYCGKAGAALIILGESGTNILMWKISMACFLLIFRQLLFIALEN